jgi:phage gpG-like protein
MRKIPVINSKTMKLTVTIDDEKLSLSLSRFGQSLTDFRRFWTDFFAPQFFADIQTNFATQGGYVGGWRALSPEYAAWKLSHYGSKPILQRRGDLINSLRIGAGKNIMKVTKAQALFGSKVPYLAYHQFGTDRMPRRIVLFFRSMPLYARLLSQFLREEMKRAGLIARSA